MERLTESAAAAAASSQSQPHFLMLEMMTSTASTNPDDSDAFLNGTLNGTFTTDIESTEPVMRYTLLQMIILSIFAVLLSILTTIGNIMVMVSFKIDKNLQTISNYFLFSLAVADFAIGIISIPLFSISTILGYWPFGAIICDSCVTRPLTYRAKRTTKRATAMIAAAWIISLILWPPWIYSWPYIEGKRTVPENECYIQFIETNQYITFGTAIAAFYFPVTVMCILYYKIWRETKKRQKDLPNLQAAGKKDSSKRSNSRFFWAQLFKTFPQAKL
uniref:G-protein coupled receptors family 1 profile domain-containing protein n=1 Tax=Megaselia scalaris TaxID=36166 RepID=T1GBU3_MEGSC